MMQSPIRIVMGVGFLASVPIWIYFVGSYSLTRDFVGLAAVSILFLFWGIRHRSGAFIPSMFSMTRPGVAITLAASCWFCVSLMDRLFAPPPLSSQGSYDSFQSADPSLRNTKITLALSGGGYRAALLHAGVAMQLKELGVPVTNIVSVSGGSIIGAFLANGGNPQDFVNAVQAGRFRLMRELTSAFELPFWLLPIGTYSRRDVQAGILRRTILPNSLVPGRGPELMIAMTDLAHVMSVGWTHKGIMLAGPTSSRFYRNGALSKLDGMGDLADIVAISGAFPGAFPAKQVTAWIAQFNQKPYPLDLILSDGGVRDNLGLKLAEEADAHQRGTALTAIDRPAFKPGPEWLQEMIIVSDGGAALTIQPDFSSPIAEVSRAIDIASLETGVLRLVDTSKPPAKIFLSLPSTIRPFPGSEMLAYLNPKWTAERYLISNQSKFEPLILRKLVDLSRNAQAKSIYDAIRSNDYSSLSVEECKFAKAEWCLFRDLAGFLSADIKSTADTFVKSPTLRDVYDETDASALVRLGRYLVLLSWHKIDKCLSHLMESDEIRPSCAL